MSLNTVKREFGLAGLVALLILVPNWAAAQEQPVEISGGWSYAHESGVSIPAGWYASGGGYVNNWFGIVGEVSGHYKTVREAGVDVKRDFHLFGVGPRFAYRGYPRLTLFLDLLAGVRRGRVAARGTGEHGAEAVADFAYQSNWGIAINNDDGSVGVRVSVSDYGARAERTWTNDTLVEIGLVIRR